MKAMIMAAGVGSRLMPLTLDRPKPMMPMCNRPLMEITVDLLFQYGIKDIICNLYHQGEWITSYFDTDARYKGYICYSSETELLGTAGGVKRCEWFLDDTFVVVSGDALTDVDLPRLIRSHQRQGALATIAVKPVEAVEEFGVVISDHNGKIVSFQEKPSREGALSNYANSGIYIFEPEIFTCIPAEQFYDFGRQVFPELVRIQAPFYADPIDNYWCDIGNLETYRQAHYDILNNLVNIEPAGQLQKIGSSNVLRGDNSYLHPDITLCGQVIIGNNCHIAAGAVLDNCVIWDHTVVGPNSHLKSCVVGDNCLIGSNCRIGEGAVVASRCRLEDGFRLGPLEKALPAKGL